MPKTPDASDASKYELNSLKLLVAEMGKRVEQYQKITLENFNKAFAVNKKQTRLLIGFNVALLLGVFLILPGIVVRQVAGQADEMIKIKLESAGIQEQLKKENLVLEQLLKAVEERKGELKQAIEVLQNRINKNNLDAREIRSAAMEAAVEYILNRADLTDSKSRDQAAKEALEAGHKAAEAMIEAHHQ